MSQQTPDDPDAPPDKDPAKLDLSWPKIFGGALAAVTTAVLGSQLGVAGTIAGAAIASIVGAVAGSLYTVGLDRTHRTFTAAVRRGADRVRGEVDDAQGAGTPASARVAAASGPGSATARTRSQVIRGALVATGAILAVSLTTITVWELVVGRSLDGSEGTSVSQVVQPRATRSATKSASPSATPTPTQTTVQPTPTASTPTIVTPTAATATATTAPPTTTAPSQPTSSAPTPTTAVTQSTTPAPTTSG